MLSPLEMPEFIESKNINLVRGKHNFNEELLQIADKNRKEFSEILRWINYIHSMEDIITMSEENEQNWENKKRFPYTITDKNNKMIGQITVHSISYDNYGAEFGYWLDIEAAGNGYMSEAIESLENILFDQGMVRIVIKCTSTNTKSNNVAKRNNYVLEGIHYKVRYRNQKFEDGNTYAKINPNFNKLYEGNII